MGKDDASARIETAKTHFQLGVGYELSGEYEEAVGAFERALEYQPEMAEAHMHLILLYTRLCRTDDAVKQCAALRSYDGDLAEGLFDSLKNGQFQAS